MLKINYIKQIIYIMFGVCGVVLCYIYWFETTGCIIFQIPFCIMIGWNLGTISGRIENNKNKREL